MIILSLIVSATVAHAAPLTLDGFLDQVRAQNKGVRGALEATRGARDSADQASLLLAPTLVGDVHHLDDRTPQAAPVFQGDRTQVTAFSLGVQKLTTFGLLAEADYVFNRTEISDVSALFLPHPQAYQAGPVVKLSQSLWRNGFGARTRAEQEQYQAQSLASSYGQSYAVRVQLAGAEAAYYRLAVAREAIRVERESLDRAQKIRDWNSRRVRLHLGDEADLLQAEAALSVRGLELQSALDEERSAARALNAAREVDSDSVEGIVPLDPESVDRLAPPPRGVRDDVKAAAEQERATVAGAEIQLETVLPDVQIYGQYGYNGRDVSPRETAWDSWTPNHPTWLVGLKFTAPIDLPVIFRSRDGQKELRSAAEATYDRKMFEADNEWRELERGFGEAKRRLKLVTAMEEAQRAKLSHEKTRFSQGRTTAFQVLTFEQDFLAAQVSRVRAEGEVVRVLTQMKTFQSDGGAEK